jgi:hypothetical protein
MSGGAAFHLSNFNWQDNELAALRMHVADIESNSEDSIILGRVSRQLISSKQAHAMLARKYEALRATLRNKHTHLKVLEVKYDEAQGQRNVSQTL